MTISAKFAHLPIARAQRSVLPPNYVKPEPRGANGDRVLVTCKGVIIGGALLMKRSTPPDNSFAAPKPMTGSPSLDSLLLQRAILDPRTAPNPNPSLLDRILNATVRPLYFRL